MPHPDTKILANFLRFPLTSDEMQCVVRVCNLLNDLQEMGTGTATQEGDRNSRFVQMQIRVPTLQEVREWLGKP